MSKLDDLLNARDKFCTAVHTVLNDANPMQKITLAIDTFEREVDAIARGFDRSVIDQRLDDFLGERDYMNIVREEADDAIYAVRIDVECEAPDERPVLIANFL